jgi:4'-phosphopantetheinyl transferase EntD
VVVDVSTAADEDELLLYGTERALMGTMIPARRREFTAGRNVARRALAQLGISAGPLLRHGTDRDIEWPHGAIGSISHTNGLCAVACARISPELQCLGLDVEQAGPLGDDIVTTICRTDELAMLRTFPPPWPSDWPRLLFTIKEGAYKAWYPVARRELSFQEMRITLDVADRSYMAEVDGNVAGGLRITGRFGWDEQLVYAGAILSSSRTQVLRPSPPPAAPPPPPAGLP